MWRVSGFMSSISWRTYLALVRAQNSRLRIAMSKQPLLRKVSFSSMPGQCVRIPATSPSHGQRRHDKRRRWVQGVRL